MTLESPHKASAPSTHDPSRKMHIVQGEFHVTDDPDVVLVTLLGSCVAACIRDPLAGVGGMNHFLLPGCEQKADGSEAERYGVHLMELLLNGLLQKGARKERLEAKLFGGARTMEGLSDIGARNAAFAERFLKNEEIKLIGGSLGGDNGRRLQFWPVSGRARQAMMAGTIVAPRPAPTRESGGDVEFF
ncbi:MAG TPA: chemotaxis protein CheD [Methylovirgula sp.]|nr:chemotaxis protein CheD [Methylovirgula sp.]